MWKTYPVATCLQGFTNCQFCSFLSWRLFFWRKPICTHNAQLFTEEKAQNSCFFQFSQTVSDMQSWAPAISRRASSLRPSNPKLHYFYWSFQIIETVTQIPVPKITPGKRKSLSRFYVLFLEIPVLPECLSSAFARSPLPPALPLYWKATSGRTIMVVSLFLCGSNSLHVSAHKSLWPRDASDLSSRAAFKALGGAHSDAASHRGHHCTLQGLTFPLQGCVQFPMLCELNSFPWCQISKSA